MDLSVENGVVMYSDQENKPGSDATLKCSPGYQPSTDVLPILCGDDGSWSGELPTCVPIGTFLSIIFLLIAKIVFYF